MRSIALRSKGWTVLLLASLLSILVNTMPAQATFVYSTDPRDTSRTIWGTGILTEAATPILADFDVTRRVVLGTDPVSGAEKFVEVSQRSILRDDRIELFTAIAGDNVLSAGGPVRLTAQSNCIVVFTISEATSFVATVGPGSATGFRTGTSLSLDRLVGNTSTRVIGFGVGAQQTVSGVLQPGRYQLGAGAGAVDEFNGPFAAATNFSIVIPGPAAATAGIVGMALALGSGRRRET